MPEMKHQADEPPTADMCATCSDQLVSVDSVLCGAEIMIRPPPPPEFPLPPLAQSDPAQLVSPVASGIDSGPSADVSTRLMQPPDPPPATCFVGDAGPAPPFALMEPYKVSTSA